MQRTNQQKLFAIYIALALSLEIFAQELPEIDAGSLLRQVKRSYEGVRSYDLLQTSERKIDGEGVSETVRLASRVACDPDLERLVCISVAEKVDNTNRTASSHAKVLLVRDGQVTRYEFDRLPTKRERRSLEEHFTEADVPNVFLIGATFYPSGVFAKDNIEELWATAIGTVATYGKVTLSGKVIEVIADAPIKPNRLGTSTSRIGYMFDPLTSLPTSFSSTYLIDAEDRVIRNERYRSSISWCEPSPGLYLPESMIVRESGLARDNTGEKRFIRTTQLTTVDFEWFSVNSDIIKTLWDPDEIMDFEAVNRLCKFPLKGK